jgi:hypothetical protein
VNQTQSAQAKLKIILAARGLVVEDLTNKKEKMTTKDPIREKVLQIAVPKVSKRIVRPSDK